MRTTLLPGLLDVARHNVARDLERRCGCSRPAACSSRTGPTSCRTSGCTSASLLAGDFEPRDLALAEASRPTSTSSRGCSSALLDALGVEWRLVDGGPRVPASRAARRRSLVGAREAGCLGELHPLVARDFGLEGLDRPPAVLELDLDVVLPARRATGAALTRT